MPPPSTRTPVRIARGSYSNLNSSISDLGDGEICYAEDQDKLYVKEGSSLVSLTFAPASPTFTGTVTIPTPTAGDNSTKAASTAFVATSFAPLASPTLTGTPAAPTASANTNTTQIATTAFVMTELGDYAPLASPALTGTATGVNLTLSGDLTVNGTTTTISTTNLDVEDKNITIGKVSTPSDTTADGGGITLLGASNKTWNWVDATDAWTSSEHIHVGDNKKFLVGTGSDLSIYHDGSNSYIKNGQGSLKICDTNVELMNGAADEYMFKAILDGAAELYFDNDKTFETVQDGIKLIGREGQSAYIYIHADEGDDNADKWVQQAGADGVFYLKSYSTGSWATALAVDGSGGVSDAKGNLRSIPANTQSSAHVAVAADAGKAIYISTGGVTINNSVFSAGDALTIINNSGSNQTITKGSGLTLYNSADATDANRTLAARGMATVWFASASVAYISGSGLS